LLLTGNDDKNQMLKLLLKSVGESAETSLIKNAEDFQLLVKILLNKDTTEFRLSNCGSHIWGDEIGSARRMVGSISQQAPSLQLLELVLDKKCGLQSPFQDVYQPMVHLTHLKIIGWDWCDRDLDRLTRSTMNLLYLEVSCLIFP
jgi:hypothetical protein